MLQDPSILWTMNIEISALIEGLNAIIKFTYKMEGYIRLVFKDGESVDSILVLYQCGRVCTLPPANRLIENRLDWAEEQRYNPLLEPTRRQTVQEVTVAHAIPRRKKVSSAACAVTFTGETNVQRQRCGGISEAELKADKQLELELENQEQESELDSDVQHQTENPPLSKKQWLDHIKNCFDQVIKNILNRFSKGGDRLIQLNSFVSTVCSILSMPHQLLFKKRLVC
jgi:hypothetical protein